MLNFASVLASGLMIYKGLGLITNTESPIVVVLRYVDPSLDELPLPHARAEFFCSSKSYSGSMEPAFHRGDLLFLINPPNTRYEIGDITVYKIPGQDIPIVHRVLETHDVLKSVHGYVFLFYQRNPVDGAGLTMTLVVVFASPNPAPKTSYCSPRGTITTSTT
jgi:signal peptidase